MKYDEAHKVRSLFNGKLSYWDTTSVNCPYDCFSPENDEYYTADEVNSIRGPFPKVQRHEVVLTRTLYYKEGETPEVTIDGHFNGEKFPDDIDTTIAVLPADDTDTKKAVTVQVTLSSSDGDPLPESQQNIYDAYSTLLSAGLKTRPAANLAYTFESIKALYQASPQELQEIPQVGPKTAKTVEKHIYMNHVDVHGGRPLGEDIPAQEVF